MFNHECTQRQGEVVGACMDGFLFGACCQLPGTVESPIVETYQQIDSSSSKPAAAISYEAYGSQSYLDDYSNELGSVDKNPSTVNYYENDVIKNDAVVISSPSSDESSSSSSYFPSSTESQSPIGEMYLPPSQNFSEELPVMISTTYGSIFNDISTENDNDFTAAGISQISNTLLNEQSSPNFNHSDITHPDADSTLVEDEEQQEINNYGQQSIVISSTTQQSAKVTYPKPQFKPKPTISSAQNDKETYVLVHTISKPLDGETTKAPESSISDNDINSIESILQQLNDTKSGQQINNNDYPSSILYSDVTPSYSSSSTDSINFNKYGQTSFYITTNQPSSTTTKQPSTSYIATSSPTTRRPGSTQSVVYDSVESDDINIENNSNYGSFGPLISSSTFKPPSTSYIGSSTPVTRRPTTEINEVHITPTTKKPIKKFTKKPITKRPTSKLPSTSYVYSPSPTKRPSSIIGSSIFASTTPTPTIILLAPIENQLPAEQVITSQNVGQSPIHSTSRPSPTVHITPKPTVNLVTSSSWTQKPSLIKVTNPTPSTSYIYTSSSSISQTPEFYHPSSVENNSGPSSPIPPYGPPISNDFYDPGYYGPTPKPAIIEHTVTSTNFYPVNDEEDQRPATVYGQTPSYPTFNGNVEISTLHNEYHTSPNDLNNFPPVRNPNLNTSATATYNNGVSYGDDIQMSTPSFVDDQVLNDKMSLLVNKIVASLQTNFENLESMVQHKNGSVVVVTQSPTQQDEKPTRRPVGTTTVDQQQTIRPSKRPVQVKKPLTTVKPVADVVVTTKVPLRTTTKRPHKHPVKTTVSATAVPRPGVTQIQSKPVVAVAAAKPVTTKKPVTRITTKRPVATKRPPARRPTTIPTPVTTKRPVRRTTTKPTRRITTTTESVLSDEYETEEEDDEIEEETDDESSTISLSDNIREYFLLITYKRNCRHCHKSLCNLSLYTCHFDSYHCHFDRYHCHFDSYQCYFDSYF